MRCDAMRCDATRRDATRRDATRRDATRRDATRRDATRRDATRRDATRRDATRRDATRRDATRRDATRRDATRRDAMRCDSPTDGGRWRRRGGGRRVGCRGRGGRVTDGVVVHLHTGEFFLVPELALGTRHVIGRPHAAPLHTRVEHGAVVRVGRVPRGALCTLT